MTIQTFGQLKVSSGKVESYSVGGYAKTNLEALDNMFSQVYKLQELKLILKKKR